MADRSIENLQIPEDEKGNIERLFSALKRAGQESGCDIETEVVGGTLNKPWPRKDIDVTVKTGKKVKGETELERAKDGFKTLSRIVKKATKIDKYFTVSKVIEPAMDEEFDSPDILKFDGVIQVEPKIGTRIELIRKK
jgi:hypothetical protein